MVDNREEVYSILSSLGFSVDYQYPKDFATFPCISYFDSGHSNDAYQDSKADTDTVEITVDVWEREDTNTGKVKEIHFDVDNLMRKANFIKKMYTNLFENDTKIYHHIFKFTKIYEEVN